MMTTRLLQLYGPAAMAMAMGFCAPGWAQEEKSPHAVEAQMPMQTLAGLDDEAAPLDAKKRTYVSRRMQPLEDVDAHAVALLPYAELAAEVHCEGEKTDQRRKECQAKLPAQTYNWKRLKLYPRDLAGSHNFRGMVFSTHYRVLGPNEPVEIAVAFRGTNFDSLSDWHSNLRWFLPGRDQYQVLAERVHEVVREARAQARQALSAEFGSQGPPAGFRFVTTGHSLGGGLAQLFAYKSSEVKAVVAFDSSPVTGHHSCVDDKEVNCNVPVWRVYQRREVLAYVRSLLRQFYSLSENITEVEINLLKGNPIFNHDITLFHKSLAAHMARRPKPPAVDLFADKLDCTCMEKRRFDDMTEPMKERCAQLQAARLDAPAPVRWTAAGPDGVDEMP